MHVYVFTARKLIGLEKPIRIDVSGPSSLTDRRNPVNVYTTL